MWNKQPEHVAEQATIVTFRKQLDKYMDKKCLDGYRPNTSKLFYHGYKAYGWHGWGLFPWHASPTMKFSQIS